jgi:hypothetical protein
MASATAQTLELQAPQGSSRASRRRIKLRGGNLGAFLC